ncbi:MAG TPA: helix-turn-helix transcriptional regulator [Candidatus Saccharimonadales bacterium]
MEQGETSGETVEPPQVQAFDKLVDRIIGWELRRARDERRLTREDVSDAMTSRISIQSIYNYESGIRPLTVARFTEICATLGVDAPALMAYAFQRAGILPQNRSLRVDLKALLEDLQAPLKESNKLLGLLKPWARSALAERPNGVMKVDPVGVRSGYVEREWGTATSSDPIRAIFIMICCGEPSRDSPAAAKRTSIKVSATERR